jgi:hypothetical protein
MGHFFRPLRIEDQTICLTSEGEAWQEGRKGYTVFTHVLRGPQGGRHRWREFRRSARHRSDKTGARRLHRAGDLRHHRAQPRGRQPHPPGHYLRRDPQIASNAIRKLEAYQVRLATA